MANDWSRGHRRLLVAAAVAGTALACSERDAPRKNPDDRPDEVASAAAGKTTAPPPETPRAAEPNPSINDAGPANGGERAATSDDFHLDGADVEYEPARREEPARKGRPIELILRSTPAGAIAAVDGEAVGPTPAVWEGSADGRPREFTFVLPGYAIARYRFVPTQSGTVHGTLGRLKSEPDAGPIAPAR